MEKATLGRTGLQVSKLGAGLSEIGRQLTMEQIDQAAGVLNEALDSGINFLDTAACYGISEELVGRTVANRRHEYYLASKCGHVAGDYNGTPWSRETVRDSIDRSLRLMNTDYVDLMQLHSCGVDVLERGEVIEELQKARDQGKIRFMGCSGDNEAAQWAVKSGYFDTLQTSFNVADQHARTKLFGPAKEQNMGIIIKRPIANGTWAAQRAPSGYAEEYYRRCQEMEQLGPVKGAPDDRILLALGFSLSHPEVTTAIVGTTKPEHMRSNIRMVNESLPISQEAIEDLHERFDKLGKDWLQRT